MSKNKLQKAVVGYVRTATLSQGKDGLSVETQKEQITKYCRAKGYKLTKIFSDNGYSEASLQRPGIQELLVEASTGKISKVVCLDLSRLSRNTFEYVFIKSQLKKYGVEVVTTTGVNTSDDSHSQVLEEMLAVINSLQPRLREEKRSRSHKGK